MKIYFEFVFLLNFLLDFMILYGTKRLLKINKSLKRILLGSMIGSLTTILLYIKIDSLSLFLLKGIFSILMNVISFGKKDLLRNTFYFYTISILIGGSIYLLDINKNYYLQIIIVLIITPILILILIKEFHKNRGILENKYLVDITIHKKIYHLEGFIDTGNQLTSPIKKEGVILVNLKVSSKKIIYVPYRALNTEGVIPCIRADKIEINHKTFNNYLIGLAKEKFKIEGANCILPNKIKEELC